MDTSDATGRLIMGTFLVVYGLVISRRRSLNLGFGGGRTAGSPLIVFEADGVSAVIIGISMIIGGIMFGFSFLFIWLGDKFSVEVFHRIPFVGLVLISLSVIVGPIVQSFMSARSEGKLTGNPKHPLLEDKEFWD